MPRLSKRIHILPQMFLDVDDQDIPPSPEDTAMCGQKRTHQYVRFFHETMLRRWLEENNELPHYGFCKRCWANLCKDWGLDATKEVIYPTDLPAFGVAINTREIRNGDKSYTRNA